MTGMRSYARSTIGDIVGTGMSLTALAVAVWLLPASIHIVSWSETGPVRLALFAPWRRLALLVAAALVLTGLVAGMLKGDRLRPLAFALAPFALLWLWAVPYLPWLPDRLPLLLVLAGPGRWIVVGVAFLGLLLRVGALDRLSSLRFAPGRGRIFAISFESPLA